MGSGIITYLFLSYLLISYSENRCVKIKQNVLKDRNLIPNFKLTEF